MILHALLAATILPVGGQDPLPGPPGPTPITTAWVTNPVPAFPEAARQRGIHEGLVRFTCRSVDENGFVADCDLINETPQNYGFASSALAAIQGARLMPEVVAMFRDVGIITITLSVSRDAGPRTFSTIALPSPNTPAAVTWVIPPRPEMPNEALNRGLRQGYAQVACRSVDTVGAISDCYIMEESPAGYGFGRAAIRAARDARVTPEARELVHQGRPAMYRVRFSQSY